MSTDRLRVVGLALASIVLIIASVFVMDWFVVRAPDIGAGFDKITFDLRAIRICPNNVCVSVELSQVPVLSRLGIYSTVAPITFWTSLAFAALVAVQAGARLIVGMASEMRTKLGYFLGTLFLGAAAGTAYLFAPDVAPFTATRTIAPLLLIAGYVVGMAALYYASVEPSAFADEPARAPLPVATALPVDTPPPPSIPRTRSRPIPLGLRGKLKYATITAELSRAGIDARREDGSARLVPWRDVVGAVARRLPPDEPYAGAAFVDIVSTAESTLRLLPWTKFSGEPLDGDGDGDARARAILALVIARCPDAKLDRVTRAFHDGGELAQLPDEPTLVQHDERLA